MRTGVAHFALLACKHPTWCGCLLQLGWMMRWGKAWRCASAAIAQAVRVQQPQPQPQQGSLADANEGSSLVKTGRSSSPSGQRISHLVKEFSEHIRRAAETTTSSSLHPGRLPGLESAEDPEGDLEAAAEEATPDRRVADAYLAVVVQPDIVQQLYTARTHLLLWRLFHRYAQTSSSSGSGSHSGGRHSSSGTMAGSRSPSASGALDAATTTSTPGSSSSSQVRC